MKPLIPFAYFGGKSKQLKHLLPQLETPHHIYCELFAGSCAALLNKPRVKYEIINDLSGDVANFWRVLREHGDALCDAIDLTPAGEVAFREAIDAPPTDDVIELARRFFVRVSQSYASIPSGKSHSNRLMTQYSLKRKDVRKVASLIHEVIVENTCACKLIGKTITCRPYMNFNKVLFYADPPYMADTRTGGGEYLIDYKGNESAEFHAKFLDTVLANEHNAKFAISGYANPLYDDALASWHRVVWPHKDGNSKTERVEVLWRNYEITSSKERLIL